MLFAAAIEKGRALWFSRDLREKPVLDPSLCCDGWSAEGLLLLWPRPKPQTYWLLAAWLTVPSNNTQFA